MKKINLNKKLNFSKTTLAELNNEKMGLVKGGYKPTFPCQTLECPELTEICHITELSCFC